MYKKKINEVKPAPYSNTDFAETEAIHIFSSVINRKIIKIDIKIRDKYPNSDGYIEIVDNTNHSIGKLEVQCKAIKKNQKKYYCSLENISYSETTTLPILLILVDIESNLVYWKHLCRNNAKMSDKGKSFIFKLSESDQINNNSNYVLYWRGIVDDYRTRIKYFDKVKNLLKMRNYSMQPKTLTKEAILYFQEFIDTINNGIQNMYPFVKRFMFPGIWKLGVLVNAFKDDISFEIFGIKKGSSDLLVKEMDYSKKLTHLIYLYSKDILHQKKRKIQ